MVEKLRMSSVILRTIQIKCQLLLFFRATNVTRKKKLRQMNSRMFVLTLTKCAISFKCYTKFETHREEIDASQK